MTNSNSLTYNRVQYLAGRSFKESDVKKTWTVQLEDGSHTVELSRSVWSGKRIVRVDGQTVFENRPRLDTGRDDAFQIGSHAAVLHSRTNGFTYNFDLSIDGRSVTTGQPVAALLPMPKWAWLYVIVCAVIPVLTLGGAVPVLIGIGGAVGCISVTRSSTRSNRAKVAWSIGITVAAWAAFLVFIGAVAGGLTLLSRAQPKAWSEFTSTSGGFAVQMPGTPKDQTQSVAQATGDLTLHNFTVEDRDYAYIVSYVDFPAGTIVQSDADAFLDSTVDGSVSSGKGELKSQSAITLGGYPGRLAEFTTVANGQLPATSIKAHYYLVKDRLYQILAIAPQGQLPAEADRFLSSFKLLDQ